MLCSLSESLIKFSCLIGQTCEHESGEFVLDLRYLEDRIQLVDLFGQDGVMLDPVYPV